MFRDRRFAKSVLALATAAAVVLAVSGCAFVKPGSLALSQPQGTGSVRVHFNVCTVGSSEQFCGPNEADGTFQYLAGIAVPPGSAAPASFTATPVGGGAPVVFTRSDEVASELAAASASLQKAVSELEDPEEIKEFEEAKELLGSAWPPAGLQGVGYLSAPVQELKNGSAEWSMDADFGLPTAADGSAFPGPFSAAIAWGFRVVGEGLSSTRPVHCVRFEPGVESEVSESVCVGSLQQAQLGTADLRIAAPAKPGQAFVGGSGQITFPLQYGGTVATLPTFALSATTTAKGGKVKLASPSFTPAAPDPVTHQAPAGSGAVTVSVPRGIKPGTYPVTLTAKTPQGGTATQVGSLKVTKPKLKLGGARLDTAKGTATLAVKIPGAGQVTVSGKGVTTVKKKAKKKTTLKVKIASTGSASALLGKAGKVKVKVKVTYKPTSGISVSKTKSVILKLR